MQKTTGDTDFAKSEGIITKTSACHSCLVTSMPPLNVSKCEMGESQSSPGIEKTKLTNVATTLSEIHKQHNPIILEH